MMKFEMGFEKRETWASKTTGRAASILRILIYVHAEHVTL